MNVPFAAVTCLCCSLPLFVAFFSREQLINLFLCFGAGLGFFFLVSLTPGSSHPTKIRLLAQAARRVPVVRAAVGSTLSHGRG